MPESPPPSTRWTSTLLFALLVLGLPALIFAVTFRIYHHVSRPADTPSDRKLLEIGRAIRAYAGSHEGNYPATLEVLANEAKLPDLAIVPGTTSTYTYLGGHLSDRRAANGTVLAFDPPATNGGTGSHVLYADGSTAWIPTADLDGEIQRGQPSGPAPE